MLAVNKQAYAENYTVFWSQNTFYLPHGVLHHAQLFFANISSRHQALIKHLAVRFSAADLTPDVLDHIENKVYTRASFDNHAGVRWALRVTSWLRDMWITKLWWLGTWRGLHEVVLENSADKRLTLSDNRPNLAINRVPPAFRSPWLAGCDQDVREFLEEALAKVREDIETDVNAMGWVNYRYALGEGVKEGLGL